MKKPKRPDLAILLEGYREELVALILKRIPSAEIYLFGSRARGDYGEGADIDIAIHAPGTIDWQIMGRLYDDINDARIPVEVDLVDFSVADGEFRKRILKDRVVWKKSDCFERY